MYVLRNNFCRQFFAGFLIAAITVSQTLAGLPLVTYETPDYQVGTSIATHPGWQVDFGQATVADNEAFDGGQSLRLHKGEAESVLASLDLTIPAGETVVFIDFRIKPAVEPELGATSTIVVNGSHLSFVKDAESGLGILYAFDGDDDRVDPEEWLDMSHRLVLVDAEAHESLDWIRISIRQDYSENEWDLYVNGQLYAAGLGFYQRGETLDKIDFHGSLMADVYVDGLQSDEVNMLFDDSDKDGIPDDYEAGHGMDSSLNDRLVLNAEGKTNLEAYMESIWPDYDFDNDTLTNGEEEGLGTDNQHPDSDGDGLSDGYEVLIGLDPNYPDIVLIGTLVADSLQGDSGNQFIDGRAGNDYLYGGDGDDTLAGGVGHDQLYGGYGDDTYLWNFGDGKEYANDSGGANILLLGEGITPEMITLERDNVHSGNYTWAWQQDPNGRDLRVAVTHPDNAALSGSVVIENWHSYRGNWQIRFADGTTWDGASLTTPGSDTLVGGVDQDSWFGWLGNDYLYGGDGDDTLEGGEGSDRLYGQNDNDTLAGGVGHDQLYGGYGDDTYLWNFGDGKEYANDSRGANILLLGEGITPEMITLERDNVHSGNYTWAWQQDPNGRDLRVAVTHPDNAALSGSVVIENWHSYRGNWQIRFADGTTWDGASLTTPGSDTLVGGVDQDSWFGWLGNDYLYGGDGDDTLEGGEGSDRLYGQNDNDTLAGGVGHDQLYGGYGDDTYLWNFGDGKEYANDSGGANILLLGEGITPEMITLERDNVHSGNYTWAWQQDPNGRDLRVAVTHPDNAALSGSVVIENWHSYRGNWQIRFADGTTWDGASLTTPGSDTLVGGVDQDSWFGWLGNDYLYGGDGDDTLEGGEGSDRLYGQNDNDTLAGGVGHDQLYGGYGDDTYLWNFGDGKEYANDSGGANILLLGEGITPEMITLERDNVHSGNYTWAWQQDPNGRDLRVAVTHPDNAALSGSVVIENWHSYRGNWQIRFADGTTWDGASLTTPGSDTLVGGVDQDSWFGWLGNDYLYGGDGDDTLEGGEGSDRLYGQNDNDTLAGGVGHDQLYGGYGDDTYLWNFGDGKEYANDSGGANILLLGEGITPEMITLERDNVHSGNYTWAWQQDPNGRDLRVAVTHPDNAALSGSVVIENWHSYRGNWQIRFADGTTWDGASLTTPGSDTLVGGVDQDSWFGWLGNDYLYGGDGDDTLEGGEGSDRLYGQNDNDTLAGGVGHDQLYGGYGDDTYLWNFGDGKEYANDSRGANILLLGEGITPEMITLERDNVHSGNYTWAWQQDPNGRDLRVAVTHPDNAALSGSVVIENWHSCSGNWNILYSGDDFDQDGLSNLDEVEAGTSLTNADTDGDGLQDGWEAANGYNPKKADTDGNGTNDGDEDFDGDGLSNVDEIASGTDASLPDTDGDGLADGWEVVHGYDPTKADSDNNGTNDGDEDLDGDGESNSTEIANGTDASDSSSNSGDGVLVPNVVKKIRGKDYDFDNMMTLWTLDGKIYTSGSPFIAFHETSMGEWVAEDEINNLSDRGLWYRGAHHTFGWDEWFQSDLWAIGHFDHILMNEGDLVDYPISRSYLKVTSSANEWAPEPTISVVTMTIPAGGRESNIIELRPLSVYMQTTVDLLPVEFITPAGDPVAQPKDAGDGQNEFTFDSAKPGILEINLKVKAPGIGGMPADIQNKFLFEIDGIGNSQMQWDPANAGGKPAFNGDFMTAKVKFTGLPQNNSDLGKKMARIKFDGNKVGEEDFEVFFTKVAENHPKITSAKEPNWFLYWKEGSVCGIPLDTIYDGSNSGLYGYVLPGTDTKLRLGPLAPASNSGPETFTSNVNIPGVTPPATYGSLTVTAQGDGIKCVAETVEHELYHLTIYNDGKGKVDGDGDGVADSSEGSLAGVKSCDCHADTYQMSSYSSSYASYGDNEVRCRKVELNGSVKVYPKKDWANPGSQHKNKFGPTP